MVRPFSSESFSSRFGDECRCSWYFLRTSPRFPWTPITNGFCHGDGGSPNFPLPLPMYTNPCRIGTCRRESFARLGRDEVAEEDAAGGGAGGAALAGGGAGCASGCASRAGGGAHGAWAGGGANGAGGGAGGVDFAGGDADRPTGCVSWAPFEEPRSGAQSRPSASAVCEVANLRRFTSGLLADELACIRMLASAGVPDPPPARGSHSLLLHSKAGCLPRHTRQQWARLHLPLHPSFLLYR